MVVATSSNSNKENNNIYFDIIDILCKRFTGLSPFEVLSTPFNKVINLYVSCILHDYNSNKKANTKEIKEKWVTSQNATWY